MGRLLSFILFVSLISIPAQGSEFICARLLANTQKLSAFLFRGARREMPPVLYSDGTQFRERNRWFGLERRIEMVQADGQVLSFNRTGRSLEQLTGQLLYPIGLVSISELRGKTVLDAGCGNGNFVRELRHQGIAAVGADAYLYSWQRESDAFVQALSSDLPFAAETFDVVYSTWSSLSYEGYAQSPETDRRMMALLKELGRVTKLGGVIRLSPVPFEKVVTENGRTEVTYPQMERWLSELPGLRISRSADSSWLSRYYYSETVSARQEGARFGASAWIEIEKK